MLGRERRIREDRKNGPLAVPVGRNRRASIPVTGDNGRRRDLQGRKLRRRKGGRADFLIAPGSAHDDPGLGPVRLHVAPKKGLTLIRAAVWDLLTEGNNDAAAFDEFAKRRGRQKIWRAAKGRLIPARYRESWPIVRNAIPP